MMQTLRKSACRIKSDQAPWIEILKGGSIIRYGTHFL